MTTNSKNRVSLGRRAALKTSTRNNNKQIQARKGRQASTQTVTTQPSSLACIKQPLALAFTLALTFLAFAAAPAMAETEGPGWQLFASSFPTNFVHGADEVQSVVPNPAEPTFKLSFEGEETAAIPVAGGAATIQSALEALPKVGKGDVAVAEEAGHGGAYAVTFTALLGDVKVAELQATNATVSVTTIGSSSGTIGVDVFNVGAGDSHGKITVTDTLPPGVKAKMAGQLVSVGINFQQGSRFGIDSTILPEGWACTGNGPGLAGGVAGATVVTCTNNLAVFGGGGGVPLYYSDEGLANPQPVVGIAVEADSEASGLKNHVSIDGGGAPEPAATEDEVTVSSKLPKPGLTHADAWFSNADGTIDTQAGSHPYTAGFVFDSAVALNDELSAYAVGREPRDIETLVPSGFIGDLHTAAQCTRAQLLAQKCPRASEVGLVEAVSTSFGDAKKPVFNMVPSPGTPAELGFEFGGTLAFFSFSVQTGGDYGIVTHVDNVPKKEAFQTIVVLWGVPEEQSHDRWRGYAEGGCTPEQITETINRGFGDEYCFEQQHPVVSPFLTLPTSCGSAQPFVFRETSGWQEPGGTSQASFPSHDASGHPAGFTGCEALDFEPQVTTSPDTAKSDTPAGLTVEVKPPLGGLEQPGAYSSADIQNTVVKLPAGMVINPGQAAGLQACGPAESELTTAAEKARGEENDGPAACPNASKVGTVVLKTPLIEADAEKQFEGNVYVLQSNPPEIKLLVAASADGVNLKLVGTSSLCETTGEVLDGKSCEAPGQVITSFNETPQLPFTLFKLSFSGGPQAALDTPTQCGTYTTNADFTPWSSPFAPDFLTNASFTLSEGPNGTPCPSNPMPFAPTLTAGATTDQAGGFTSFSMLLQRGDGQQRIEKLQFKAPQGLSGMISQVPLCDEADANAGTCPASSHIGHATVTSGPGPYPLVIPQPGEPELPIYLTGPYKGAPFGLSIVTPVLAGPFNLGTVVTRAKIEVDPTTAQITITTGPLPQIVKGVPTDLRSINAVIDRPGFMFNPTNCNPQEFTGTAWGTPPPGAAGPGATAPISSHFGIGSCRSLQFAPKFTVSVPAKTSKQLGAGLTATVSEPANAMGTQANLTRVKVQLPRQLPSQLKTLQKACLAATFESSPESCPAHSIVGHAVVHTPLLPVPLEGKAYFVSHGGEAFPSLTMVLKGYGVTVDLVGTTFISPSSITSTTFQTVPDVPFTSFTLTLDQGEYAALGSYLPGTSGKSFCGQKLVMPTEFVAQNGLEIHQSTPIAVTGCPPSVSITRTQVKGNSLAVTVNLGQQGTVKITGRGLRTTTRRGLKAGTHTITVPLTATGRAAKRHKSKLKVQAALTVSGRTGTATATLRA